MNYKELLDKWKNVCLDRPDIKDWEEFKEKFRENKAILVPHHMEVLAKLACKELQEKVK